VGERAEVRRRDTNDREDRAMSLDALDHDRIGRAIRRGMDRAATIERRQQEARDAAWSRAGSSAPGRLVPNATVDRTRSECVVAELEREGFEIRKAAL
jgi:hypothetical protein